MILDKDNTNLSITPPESPLRPLFGASESNSSKNIIQGTALLAWLNTRKKFLIHGI